MIKKSYFQAILLYVLHMISLSCLQCYENKRPTSNNLGTLALGSAECGWGEIGKRSGLGPQWGACDRENTPCEFDSRRPHQFLNHRHCRRSGFLSVSLFPSVALTASDALSKSVTFRLLYRKSSSFKYCCKYGTSTWWLRHFDVVVDPVRCPFSEARNSLQLYWS
jgi:hypothetical protein